MPPGPVTVERRGGVGILTLASPPANALDLPMVEALAAAIETLGADPDVRVLLVRSALRLFAAGADLATVEGFMAADDRESIAAYLRQVNATFDRFEALPQPVVVALGGHALGGGFELALACDLRLAADSPGIKLGLPEARLGLLPAAGGTQRLGRLVGRSRAFALLVPGRTLTPREAFDLGLVHRLVSADELGAESLAEAERLADGPAEAYAAIKRCLVAGLDRNLAGGQALEFEAAMRLLRSPDAREGVAALRERRTPRFGRGAGDA